MANQDHQYPDGSSYSGKRDQQGHPHGFGALTLGDGTMFTGMFEQGLFSGLGILFFPEGTRYEGEFKEGKFNGYGVFHRTDKMKFEGEFKDGQMWGQGLVTFANGSHGLPRMEGFFQGHSIVRREKCSRSIRRARDTADKACCQTGQ